MLLLLFLSLSTKQQNHITCRDCKPLHLDKMLHFKSYYINRECSSKRIQHSSWNLVSLASNICKSATKRPFNEVSAATNKRCFTYVIKVHWRLTHWLMKWLIYEWFWEVQCRSKSTVALGRCHGGVHTTTHYLAECRAENKKSLIEGQMPGYAKLWQVILHNTCTAAVWVLVVSNLVM